jgi:hypothetical protein
MMLENKTAVIYGGGGAIGGAVARACAAPLLPTWPSRTSSLRSRPSCGPT